MLYNNSIVYLMHKEEKDMKRIGFFLISAALTCVNRGKMVAVIANGAETSNLYKAEKITNYPGIPDASGKEISEILRRQLESSGADLIHGRALNVIPLGDSFGAAVGSDFTSSSAVIIAAGITRAKRLYVSAALVPAPEMMSGVLASSMRIESTSSTMAKW